ncbi:MAG: sugar transferase [Bacteroidales bacterium]|nr:sugar transferase [Bacteroidales bacterium]MCM1414568.1 sugar transferase [bacterium]MCM1422618.1 sugar transferase [bacterium]
MNRRTKLIESYLLLAADLVSISLAYAVAILIRFEKFARVMEPELHFLVYFVFLLFCTIYSFLFDWNREFLKRGVLVELIAVTKFNVFMELAVMACLFMLQRGADVSRLVIGYFAILNVLLVWLVRLGMKKALRIYFTANSNIVKIMIITKKALLQKTVKKLKEAMDINYEIVALACVDADAKEETFEEVTVNAGREDVLTLARQMPLDEVFLNLPDEDMVFVKHMIYDLESMGIACHYNIDIIERPSKEVRVGNFAGYTVVTYSINHFDYRRMVVKRGIDILGGLVGCLITLVITPFAALAIKLDSPGPVFFSQTRIGKNGRRFKIYKFRSMYVDAEARKKELEKQNEMQGLMFKMENDPRITRVGRFLRKTSIDELPQFLNIVRGDMSLVGTRPPTEEEFEQYNSHYRRRISMTPGLTGLWQISGRSEIVDFDEVVRLDLEYIDNWTLGLDIKILLRTVWVVLTGKGSK